MKSAMKCLTGKSCRSASSAKVIEGKLILSFPNAINPVVWQMDLGQTKASALEVQTNGDETRFTLVLKTPKGETVDIAPFESRQEAVDGLMAAAKALENAQGHIRAAASNSNYTPGEAATHAAPARKNRWLGPVLAALFIFVLFMVWASLLPKPAGIEVTGMPQSAMPAAPSPEGAAGVPLDADAYLKGQ